MKQRADAVAIRCANKSAKEIATSADTFAPRLKPHESNLEPQSLNLTEATLGSKTKSRLSGARVIVKHE